jgi:transposase
VRALQESLVSRTVEIEQLKLLIAKLRRMQFGRKSEKLDRQIEQLELKLEDLQADEGASATRAHRNARPPRKPSIRKPLPAHLPRQERAYPTADRFSFN